MRALGLAWLGLFPDRFDDTVAFFRDVIGLAHLDEDDEVAQLSTERGDIVEVFRPQARYDFATTGPIPGFLVQDAAAAVAALEAAGATFLGESGESQGHAWQHFQAPDGNGYEVTSGPYRPTAPGRGLRWAGVRTARHEAMASFLQTALGLEVRARPEGMTKLAMANGDEFEVFSQDEPDHLFMDTGPVVALEVADLDRTREAIDAQGLELFGGPRVEGPLRWQHFRGPDGCVHEILERGR